MNVSSPSAVLQAFEMNPAPFVEALEHPLPKDPFYSVEYPGYVLPTSVPLAVRNLGGQASLDNAFKRATSKTESLLELTLTPGQPFAHAIPGDVVGTNNILLKIVKRKRKRVDRDHDDGAIGEYTAEAIGIIPKTVRFRSERYSLVTSLLMDIGISGMVDYQYQPDVNDPISELRLGMSDMNGRSSLSLPLYLLLMNYRCFRSRGFEHICHSRRESRLSCAFNHGSRGRYEGRG
jgi:general transcription factor 3C polypeptide 5 (transcription factor C subunit 1)